MAASQFVRKPDEPGQRTRCLDHRKSAIAAEPVLAFDHHGKVEALVENLGEWPCRIQCQRTQHRLHFALEVGLEPFGLRFGPGVRGDEYHAVSCEFRQQHLVQQLVLLVDQAHGAVANRLEGLRDRQPVGRALHRACIEKLLQARHADFEKLVQVRAADAKIFHALEQGNAPVLGLRLM